MPRYFFHVIDGAFLIDAEGVEYDSLNDVRDHAVYIASKIMSGEAGEFPSGTKWQLHVTDERSDVILRLKFMSEWGLTAELF